MHQIKLLRYLFFGIFILVILISVLQINQSNLESKIERKRYFEKKIVGKLISKSINRGISIELLKGDKVEKDYLYNSINFNLSPSNLYDFLQKNDSIVKPKNSLNLFVYRGEREFYFELGRYINKK